MSGTTPPPGSGSGEEENPYAQSGQGRPPEQPWQSAPPPSGPPAWSAPADPGPSAWGDPAPAPSEPPPSIRRAVLLMYVGAGISALLTVIFLATGDSFRDTWRDSLEDTGDMTADDIDSVVNGAYGFVIAIFVIAILLWVWMATANKKGRGWARILSTVLGVLFILYSLLTLVGGGIGTIIGAVSIALAGYILYLLYRPDSSAYYAAMSGRRR